MIKEGVKNTSVMEVIDIEKCNTAHIHLYLYKDKVWGCCGRSAVLLHQLYPNLPCAEREIYDTGICLPGMIIDLMTLQHLIQRLPPIEQTLTRIVFEVP